MGEIVEQANFWNQNISPILGFDPAFVDWLNICDENEPNRESGQESPFDLGEDGLQDVPSHSFSIQEDPYEQNKINKGRCFAAVYDPDNSLLPLFGDVAANFAPMFVGSFLLPCSSICLYASNSSKLRDGIFSPVNSMSSFLFTSKVYW